MPWRGDKIFECVRNAAFLGAIGLREQHDSDDDENIRRQEASDEDPGGGAGEVDRPADAQATGCCSAGVSGPLVEWSKEIKTRPR